MMEETGSDNRAKGPNIEKSYFDVLGLCCSSEVPLIEKILKPMKGVQKVTVIVPSKTVIVVHESTTISQLQIVKALNQAKLEASIRAYGASNKVVKEWPSPYIIVCGVLLLASLFKHFFHPLQWLAVAAVVVGLPPILFRSFAALRRFTLDINILMVIAVVGAVAMKDFSEAGFIVFLLTIAEWLNSRASHKATAGMSTLMSMAPQKAVLAETDEVVDAQKVMVGTILAVKAGELIPIDGIVVDGRSEVNESSLTGESFPVAKQAESLVWAGTLNVDGYISVRTTALAENSAVAKMARLVEEAQNNRSNTQRLIDTFAKYYTPAVVVIAVGIVITPLILKAHNPKHWFKFALVLLVSACPCALVLSTPVATFCALLTAARIGLLVKGGDVLEALAKTRVVAFDKTGTITMGEFTVMEFRSLSRDVTMDKLLYWVSSIECKSSHPMASTLVDYARMKSIEPKPDNVTEFQIYPGEGIYGKMDGMNIYVGNKRIAARAGCVAVPSVGDMKDAVTMGYVFLAAVPIGIFTLSDTCRTGSAEAIKELKSLGIKIAMLTGDSTVAAMHAQSQLENAIEMLHAELLPEDKVRIISDLKSKQGSTVMVGDGLNDAPALAMANVGISMGISGSAVAMETSHITLMSNDIRKIPKAIRLARRTHRKIIVNMFFSMITKIAVLAIAIAGHPLLWAAVLADVGTCLIVILNSMMLLKSQTAKEDKCCSSHKSQGQCCGSSHKSHAHTHAGEGHCSGGKCGSGSHAHSHDHGTAECGNHKHSCHDHEEESAHHNCSSMGNKGTIHSHCGPSHKSHAHCSGSSHKSHAHKPACGDHCSGGKCESAEGHGGGSTCGSNLHGHSSHDHETVEEVRGCKKSCHDHEHLISITTTGQEYHADGLQRDEYLILMTDEVENHKDETHEEHSARHTGGCCKSDSRKDSHSHNHDHGHGHNHSHAHGHNHVHDHSHDHGHDHSHGHNHDHGHDHSHGHNHSHAHGHNHGHSHDHVHDHSHSHSHGLSHDHGHDHSHGHNYSCSGDRLPGNNNNTHSSSHSRGAEKAVGGCCGEK